MQNTLVLGFSIMLEGLSFIKRDFKKDVKSDCFAFIVCDLIIHPGTRSKPHKLILELEIEIARRGKVGPLLKNPFCPMLNSPIQSRFNFFPNSQQAECLQRLI